ncbi:FAD-dependent oxidoreductase [Frigidibacter sp. MR17.14]|uniref:FAD-dependent oxidoreductase n=1 Tax=Frigidibacter sp. MR17.14 TaxID=3126509 RepID=UPI00301303AC
MSDDKPDLAKGVKAKDLREASPIIGFYEGQEVILIRHGRELSALSAKCTHLGASLDKGLVVEGQVRCPWHHARFSLADGTAEGGPAIQSLSCFRVEETDGLIRVLGKKAAPSPKSKANAERIVIVGTGAGGHSLAAALGRAGRGADVTLIGAEPDAPYDRTFCSKQYLQGGKSRDECFLPAEGLDQVKIRTGTEITGVDVQSRELETAQGERIGYDRLVLATGASPKRPDFPGAEQGHLLRSLADADAFIAAATTARTAVVLGASFIGLEVAAALRSRGIEVTVVAQGTLPLARILGDEAGRHIMNLHIDKGVRFRMGETVASFEDGTVVTDAGARIPTDLLVLGTGVAPRVGLAEAAGLDLAEGGVAVDATLRSSDPAIWAIGDIAAVPVPLSGQRQRIEHWVHAQRMGEHLAQDFLAGTATPFRAAPFFWTGFYGKQFRYVGHARPEQVEVDGDVQGGTFAIRYRDASGSALLTSGRDMLALEDEQAREVAARS